MKYFGDGVRKDLLLVICLGMFIIPTGYGSQPSKEAEHLDQKIESLQQEAMQPLSSAQNISHTQSKASSAKGVPYNPLPSSNTMDANQALNHAAFQEAMQNALPLSPEQIIQLKEQFYQRRAAMAAFPNIPPKPVIASRYVNLAPGNTPMVIRLAQGYVSALAFLDETGQPWPIDSYTVGGSQDFELQWNKKDNLLMIKANTPYNAGDFSQQSQKIANEIIKDIEKATYYAPTQERKLSLPELMQLVSQLVRSIREAQRKVDG